MQPPRVIEAAGERVNLQSLCRRRRRALHPATRLDDIDDGNQRLVRWRQKRLRSDSCRNRKLCFRPAADGANQRDTRERQREPAQDEPRTTKRRHWSPPQEGCKSAASALAFQALWLVRSHSSLWLCSCPSSFRLRQ